MLPQKPTSSNSREQCIQRHIRRSQRALARTSEDRRTDSAAILTHTSASPRGAIPPRNPRFRQNSHETAQRNSVHLERTERDEPGQSRRSHSRDGSPAVPRRRIRRLHNRRNSRMNPDDTASRIARACPPQTNERRARAATCSRERIPAHTMGRQPPREVRLCALPRAYPAEREEAAKTRTSGDKSASPQPGWAARQDVGPSSFSGGPSSPRRHVISSEDRGDGVSAPDVPEARSRPYRRAARERTDGRLTRARVGGPLSIRAPRFLRGTRPERGDKGAPTKGRRDAGTASPPQPRWLRPLYRRKGRRGC